MRNHLLYFTTHYSLPRTSTNRLPSWTTCFSAPETPCRPWMHSISLKGKAYFTQAYLWWHFYCSSYACSQRNSFPLRIYTVRAHRAGDFLNLAFYKGTFLKSTGRRKAKRHNNDEKRLANIETTHNKNTTYFKNMTSMPLKLCYFSYLSHTPFLNTLTRLSSALSQQPNAIQIENIICVNHTFPKPSTVLAELIIQTTIHLVQFFS